MATISLDCVDCCSTGNFVVLIVHDHIT